MRARRPFTNEFWDTCKDLKFNSSFPDCVGQVVTYQGKSAEGPRSQFRCSRCRKQLSQLTGSNGGVRPPRDRLGCPNVGVMRKEIMWLTFSCCLWKEMSVALTKELMHGEFALIKLCKGSCAHRPPLNQVIQVDECLKCLKQGKRKGNRVCLFTGNGPWVFGMVSVETKEVRLFKVDSWDAATLGDKITQNTSPGTTIDSNE
ncbi:hypothetical protein HPB48_022481 [Haemaphysalis longicornis]|uniref:Uncharacterized protein n=1 Tax=Haemaphysalis longicornis TaxID=44386 RepID=A0A9J6GAN8_HAELO|nr:hypothetical protein HPB48_022481 [Haemaphysalis longicornis]